MICHRRLQADVADLLFFDIELRNGERSRALRIGERAAAGGGQAEGPAGLQHNLQASGTLSLTASGRGTFANPQGTASLTIPQLDIEKQQVRNVSLQAAVANHEATFTLGSQVLNAPLKAQGKVALT